MNQEVNVQIARLQNNLPLLATAASTAPYVGLFGTVLGILSAFRMIAETGQTGAAVVAGGISEALIATALGLGVAIPAVMAYNYFTARVNTLSLQIETHALDLTELMVVRSAPETATIAQGETNANRS
jgi:biopolymer transport protein ExbB/TolQ